MEVAHRLVQNLDKTGLKLGDDGRVTGRDAVLARAAWDDDLTAANTERVRTPWRYTGGADKQAAKRPVFFGASRPLLASIY